MSLTVIRVSPLASPAEQSLNGARASATFTIVTMSATVTWPLWSQSPAQRFGVTLGVGDGDAAAELLVAVAVGVLVAVAVGVLVAVAAAVVRVGVRVAVRVGVRVGVRGGVEVRVGVRVGVRVKVGGGGFSMTQLPLGSQTVPPGQSLSQMQGLAHGIGHTRSPTQWEFPSQRSLMVRGLRSSQRVPHDTGTWFRQRFSLSLQSAVHGLKSSLQRAVWKHTNRTQESTVQNCPSLQSLSFKHCAPARNGLRANTAKPNASAARRTFAAIIRCPCVLNCAPFRLPFNAAWLE
jgi:hypothetical protein